MEISIYFGSIINNYYRAQDIDILIQLKNPTLTSKVENYLEKLEM